MRPTFGFQVLIAVIAGIGTGLFLGPLASFLHPISSIYGMLVQMVVLPYICLSIILGLGSLTSSMAKHLFKRGWPFWFLLWGVMFLLIFLVGYIIPKPLSIMFTQTGTLLINEQLTKNILTYLIPENPIYDFVNNIVPSIAIFGVIVGVALMHIDKKEPLISLIERSDRVIEKILNGLTILSPVGVYAYISVEMGTVGFSDFNTNIGIYYISLIFIVLFITFCVLPIILSNFTSLSFRQAVRAIWDVCLLPFLTGIPAIAIPFINLHLKKLGQRHAWHHEPEFRSITQTVVPISYSFAQIGNCLLLFFILFASFYYRHPSTASEKSLLSFLMIPLSVGSSSSSLNTISFLFQELKFPDDAMILLIQTLPITMSFQILLSIASVLTFILVVVYSNYRFLQVKWTKFLFQLIGSLSLAAAAVFWVAPSVHLQDNYHMLYRERRIADVIQYPLIPQIYLRNEPLPAPRMIGNGGVLKEILRSGVLRVGYESGDEMPYAYLNNFQELVGFDISMAYQLAHDLNCKLELIPIDLDNIAEELNSGLYDIVMSGILMNSERILQMSFSDTYADQNYVLIVPEKKRSRFVSLEKVQGEKSLVFGAFGGYKNVYKLNFSASGLYEGTIIKGVEMDHVDAWILNQVSATMWCVEHPGYSIVDFGGDLGKCYRGYPMRTDDSRFLLFINNWMQLKILDSFYKEQNDYWILGKIPPKEIALRWSIIRNVLHWIE
jgi:proton glutamate symport protein